MNGAPRFAPELDVWATRRQGPGLPGGRVFLKIRGLLGGTGPPELKAMGEMMLRYRSVPVKPAGCG
jgi:hypothetical protein